MNISIDALPDGKVVVQFDDGIQDEGINIDIEPNAHGEDEHVYVTIEYAGQTYEGRLPVKSQLPPKGGA